MGAAPAGAQPDVEVSMADGPEAAGAFLVDHSTQVEQLGVFSRLIALVACAFGITAVIAALTWADWRFGAVGAIVLGYATNAWLAVIAVERGRDQRAALMLGFGVIVGALLIAWVQPALGLTVAQAALIPLTIALLHCEPQSRRFTLAFVAIVASVVCASMWRLRPVPSHVPDWFLGAYQVLSFVAVFVLVVVLIHQWRERYQRQLSKAREARAELERESTRWRATLLAQYDAVIATDEHGCVTLMNAAAEAMTDTKLSAVIGKHITDTIFFETEQAQYGAADFFARALETGQGYSEVRGVELASRRGEHRSQIAVSAAPINTDDGRLIGVIFTFRDMTDHMRLVERTQGAERMKAVERMAAGVAGDLSDALAVIAGSSEKLKQQLQAGSPLKLDDIDAIIDAGKVATRLTNQLLAIGQRQPGKPTICDLGILVAKVAEIIPPMLGRDIIVSSRNQVGLGQIEVDEEQIHQALIQLALHARHAMPHGGKLEFETSNEFVDAPAMAGGLTPPQLGAYVRLVVRDSGGGLDDDDLQHVLEPYYSPRRQSQKNRQPSEAALRLSVVNGIVKQNGGYLTVESRIRVGSTFTMFFPRVDVKNWLNEVMKEDRRAKAATARTGTAASRASMMM
jgi:PAS domain S-box-containing protein